MALSRRARIIVWGVLGAVLILVVTAFALGGSSGSGESGSAAGSSGGVASEPAHSVVGQTEPAIAAPSAAPFSGDSASSGASGSSAAAPGSSAAKEAATAQGDVVQSAVEVTATSVVKTGALALRVDRGQVQPTMAKLVSLTTSMGGYVSQSHTDSAQGVPSGELTLRMPVAHFDATVAAAERYGHVTSLTTSAHDVTGRVVDLGARLQALAQTRRTYLTILGRATTIGATLEVQQRVDDVQQQIEELQGELKVLRNQSADGTLTVDVVQAGAPVVVHHPHSGGLGQAWHTSIDRFARGFDAIVSALGPLLLAILVLAVLAGIAGLGYRGVRRATS